MSVKTSVNLPEPAIEALRELAEKRDTTMTEVLRHAISLEKAIDDEVSEGGKVLIKKGDQVSHLLVT
jgi:predicted transcriptional regulator